MPRGVYTYKFPRMVLTVDAVVFAVGDDGVWNVLLIQRKKDPFEGQWAFPGGHVDPEDQSVEHAAARELWEETGLEISVDDFEQLKVYSAPDRDPRDRVISVAHVVMLHKKAPPVKGADDALEAQWFPLAEALALELAFDHYDILADAERAVFTDRACETLDRAELGRMANG
jgi:8-oxo-dGTP diphosphatase